MLEDGLTEHANAILDCRVFTIGSVDTSRARKDSTHAPDEGQEPVKAALAERIILVRLAAFVSLEVRGAAPS